MALQSAIPTATGLVLIMHADNATKYDYQLPHTYNIDAKGYIYGYITLCMHCRPTRNNTAKNHRLPAHTEDFAYMYIKS